MYRQDANNNYFQTGEKRERKKQNAWSTQQTLLTVLPKDGEL